MKTLVFKTDIKECRDVNEISTYLDRVGSIQNWEVDTRKSERFLTVRGKNVDIPAVLLAVKKGGFKAEFVGETKAI